MVKISVIIPVYNAEKYLIQCLDSICNQSLQDIEIICVDDGSTDTSYAILLEYQKKDTRIQIYQQTNQYAGAARNHGMRHATGKYLLFLDADDYFKPTLLEKMYSYAEANNLQVTVCQYDTYREDIASIVPRSFSEVEAMIPEGKDVFSAIDLQGNGIFQLSSGWAWDKLFLREYVIECGYEFPTMRSSEDGFFSFMLMARAERIGYMKEVLITYRLGNQNSLSSTKDTNWENGFLMLDMIYKELNRLGIYGVYQNSFLRFVVEFDIWYMESMNTVDAFVHCYRRIQEDEKKYQILGVNQICCSEYLLKKYENIITSSPEQYLFSETKNMKQLQEKEYIYKATNKKGWLFPFEKIPQSQNILLYGAGAVGKAYFEQLSATEYANRVIWVDKCYDKYCSEGFDVVNPESVDFQQIDYAVIAIISGNVVKDVKLWLIDKGISVDKIID